MENSKLIYQRLAAISADVPTVPKSKKCSDGAKFAYRGIDDVVAAVKGLMGKHNVFCSPRVTERHQEAITSKGGAAGIHAVVSVVYQFYCGDDGSSLEVGPVVGEATDYGDKAFGKAQTYAYKVMLCELFSIPVQDAWDPDATSGESPGDVAASESKPPSIPEPTEAERRVIDEVCRYYPAPSGMRVDPAAVGRTLWAARNKYPGDISKAEAAAKWLVGTNRNVCIPDDGKAEGVDLLAETLTGMTEAQKKQMGILTILLQERADAELDGVKIDKRELAGWVLEVSPTGYPNTEEERKAIEAKASLKIIKTRMTAKA